MSSRLPGFYRLTVAERRRLLLEATGLDGSRMVALDPDWIYVTHYGRVGEVPRVATLLLGQLAEMVASLKVYTPDQVDVPARGDSL